MHNVDIPAINQERLSQGLARVQYVEDSFRCDAVSGNSYTCTYIETCSGERFWQTYTYTFRVRVIGSDQIIQQQRSYTIRGEGANEEPGPDWQRCVRCLHLSDTPGLSISGFPSYPGTKPYAAQGFGKR